TRVAGTRRAGQPPERVTGTRRRNEGSSHDTGTALRLRTDRIRRRGRLDVGHFRQAVRRAAGRFGLLPGAVCLADAGAVPGGPGTGRPADDAGPGRGAGAPLRSEEHTSE